MINKIFLQYIKNNCHKFKTPTIVYNLDVIKEQLQTFNRVFTNIEPFYAVKANSATPILKTMKSEHKLKYDAASINEIKKCINLGISPNKISYANICKKVSEIKEAYELGIRLFIFDCKEELLKLHHHAPQAQVICRISVDEAIDDSAWSLGKKFGCCPQLAEELLTLANSLNVIPYGTAFHVGSQNINGQNWQHAIKVNANIWKNLQQNNINLKILNIGGGLPVQYKNTQHLNIQLINDIIQKSISKYFSQFNPRVIMEPGRFLVAESAILISEVITVAQKKQNDLHKWIYLDTGRYGGLIETVGDSIIYFIDIINNNKSTLNHNNKLNNYIIAGNTCDSFDTLYQNTTYQLSQNISAGDMALIYPAGAYVAACASKHFNGFCPPQEIFLSNNDINIISS